MNQELKKWRITWEANNRFEAQKRKKAHTNLEQSVQNLLSELSNDRLKRYKEESIKRKADFIRHKIAMSSWLKKTKMAHQENYKNLHQNLTESIKTLKKYTLNLLITFIENNKEQTIVQHQKRLARIGELKTETH